MGVPEGGVFLCYRRDDSAGYAGRLHESLVRRLGDLPVFIDVVTLEPGGDYVRQTNDALQQCRAMVVVIGPRWIDAVTPTGSRRIDEPDDFVRHEIETALRSGLTVVPLLVGGARMPDPTELPSSLAELSGREALELSDRLWPESITRLLTTLAPSLGSSRTRWEPDPDAGIQIPLPARLERGPVLGFVGRVEERTRIAEALKRAGESGRPVTMLIAGEAGIGKTTLAREVARSAFADATLVLYGRSDDELGIPYQPWVEALRHLILHLPAPLLAEQFAAHGAELARLVPELTDRLGELPVACSTDPETERYLLFAAVLGLLERLSEISPIVLVLDDLHWADKPTFLLLRYLLSATEHLRMLIVAIYRPTDLSVGHPLADLVAALHREEGTERIELGGFGDRDVVDLMESAAGYELGDDAVQLAHAVYRETDGNPFFAVEILRHLVESGTVHRGADGRWLGDVDVPGIALPSSAREVIGRRVARLGERAELALHAAAVIGREFDLSVLAGATDMSDEALLDVMDAASRVALVSEISETTDRFTFAHALIEHALYDDLGASRRARLHRRVAEAIEAVAGGDPGDRVGELAYHWARATAPREPTKAIDYARDAGDRALAQLAPDAALRWYRQAIDLVDREPATERTYLELLVRLGDAQRQAGDPAYRTTLLDAGHQAEQAGATDLVVHAALANSRGFFSTVGLADQERIALLETALRLVGDEPTAARARILALLAQELVPTGNLPRRQQLSDDALGIARGLSNPAALLDVLNLRFNAILSPDTLGERLSVTAEAVALAEQVGDPVAGHFANMFRAFASLDAGDRDELDRAAGVAIRLADQVRQPVPQWIAAWERALLALLDGDLEAGEAHVLQALTLGYESGQPDAELVPGGILMNIRWMQGRGEELEPMILQLLDATPDFPMLRGALCGIYADHGRVEEAHRLLDAEVADRFTADDSYQLATLVAWSHAAADLDDTGAAELLLPHLLSHRDQIGASGVVVTGVVATSIGQMRTLLGNFEEGEAALRDGVSVAQRLRAPYFIALNDCWWAWMLLRRDEAGDRDAVEPLLAQALEVAARHGLAGIDRRVARLRGQHAC